MQVLIPAMPHTRRYLPPGTRVMVRYPKHQGPRFRKQVGTVRESTRSLAAPFPRVYFIRFDDLGISAWFAEDQLEVEVQE